MYSFPLGSVAGSMLLPASQCHDTRASSESSSCLAVKAQSSAEMRNREFPSPCWASCCNRQLLASMVVLFQCCTGNSTLQCRSYQFPPFSLVFPDLEQDSFLPAYLRTAPINVIQAGYPVWRHLKRLVTSAKVSHQALLTDNTQHW